MLSQYIWRPKILVTVWILAALSAGSLVAVAQMQEDDEGGYFVPDPIQPVVPTVAPDASTRVDQALRSDDTAQALLQDNEFTIARIAPSLRLGEMVGTHAEIELARPITASGPWKFLKCQGTRQRESAATWTNVTTLSVVVDEAGQILLLAPSTRFDEEGAATNPPRISESDKFVMVRSLPGGDKIWSGQRGESEEASRALSCPPGTDDD